jgi:hypothetical protein
VLQGDPKSAETVRRVIDQNAKLEGAYAPVRHEVLTMGAIEAEIARLAGQLGEPAGGGVGVVPSGGGGGGGPVGGPEVGAAT